MAKGKSSKKGTASLEEVKLDRSIGLLGGISLVIGGVIGMGIYALIAEIGAQVGSTLWLAFVIAMAISIIGVIPIIQIASALPRAGAGYLYASRLLNPLMGTIASWWVILGGSCSTAFVALGLAGYIKPLVPWDISIQMLAIILPILFVILYLFGLKIATWIQVIFAAVLIIILLVYGIKGTSVYGLHFSTTLPQGVGGLILASILSYSVCMGFQVIAEMGEEMKNAKKNIPLSLLIGGGIVLVIYIIVGTVFTNSVPYEPEAIRSMTAPLRDSGESFLSPFFVTALSFGALAAGLTSFNAGAIALPRELFSQARDGIMPQFIGKISRLSKSPYNAVIVFFAIVVFLILLNDDIDFYGVMAAVGLLLMTALISIAALRLPKKYPDQFKNAYFRLPVVILWIIAILSIITCIGFASLVVFTEIPVAGLIYVIFTAAVIVFYFIRVWWIKRQGIDWKAKTARLPGFDEK